MANPPHFSTIPLAEHIDHDIGHDTACHGDQNQNRYPSGTMHTRHDVADDDASAEVPDVSRSRAAAVFPASCFSAHPAATAYNRYNGTAPPSGGHHRGKRHVQDAGCHAGAFCPFSSSPFPHAGIHYAVFSPARHVPAPTRATRPTGRKSGISPRLTIHDTYRFPSFFSRQIPSYSNRHRCAREKPFFL